MRTRQFLFLVLPFLAFCFVSCGLDKSVKKGDRFEVLTELKEAADIQGNQSYSDGFTCVVPVGTIIEALFPASSSGYFECRPVVVNGNSSKQYINETLIPAVVSNRQGFETFSLTLKVDYIGTKLKRLN